MRLISLILNLGFLIAAVDGFAGAVELRQPDIGKPRMQRQVRRIAGEPCPRNAILDDVEGLDHDGCYAMPAFVVRLRLGVAIGRGLMRGGVLDDGRTSVEVVMQIDRHDELLFVGAADGDRHRIDQRAIDQRASVAHDGLEDAG